MPIYRFQIDNPAGYHAAELCDLPDDAAARTHAMMRAEALIRDPAAHFVSGEKWRISATDENGVACAAIDVSGADAPSVGSHSYSRLAAQLCFKVSSSATTLA